MAVSIKCLNIIPLHIRQNVMRDKVWVKFHVARPPGRHQQAPGGVSLVEVA